jgi:hypothetical protein
MRHKAIYETHSSVVSIDGDFDAYDIEGNLVEIDESLVSSRLAELQAAEPLRLLREKRNQLLQQTDWMAVSDRTMTQAQIDYRQALRDITTQTPSLDSNGQLTGVNWPTPPND